MQSPLVIQTGNRLQAEFVVGQILHLKSDQAQSYSNLSLMLRYSMLGLFVPALIAGFAHRIEDRTASRHFSQGLIFWGIG